MSRSDANGLVVIMTPKLLMPRQSALAKIFVADCGVISKVPSVRDPLNNGLVRHTHAPRARRQITGIKKVGTKKSPTWREPCGAESLSGVPLNHERYLRFVEALLIGGSIAASLRGLQARGR